MTAVVEAEQFLPKEGKIPKVITSDGPRNPNQDSRSSWILKTEEGATYVKDGDYVIKNGESYYLMPAVVFEANYKLAEEKPEKK